MNITYATGDATDPFGDDPKILAHVCNNRGGWGRGFVLAISTRWPEPEAAYRAHLPHLGSTGFVRVRPDLIVANMVAQSGYKSRNNPKPLSYTALTECLRTVHDKAARTGSSVHMPLIGCGLAGGNWLTIEGIINETLTRNNVPVTIYTLP